MASTADIPGRCPPASPPHSARPPAEDSRAGNAVRAAVSLSGLAH